MESASTPALDAPSPKKFLSKSEQSVAEPQLPSPAPAKQLPPSPMKPKFLKKRTKIILISVAAVVILLLVPIVYSAVLLKGLTSEVSALQTHSQAAISALKNQDLPTAKSELDASATTLTNINHVVDQLSFWRFTPLFAYYSDAQAVSSALNAGIETGQMVIASIEPYADVLGLKGKGTFQGGTAEDRLVKLVSTLKEVTPVFASVQEKLSFIDNAVSQIDPRRYPFSIKGKSMKDLITQSKTLLGDTDAALKKLQPLITLLPDFLGADQPKKYLILFQNDAELRPTGGFLTAYSIVTVNSGKITPVKSDDIYSLDAQFTQKVPAPAVITKYLINDPNWRLRDMNLSPDFKVSMDTFMKYYQTISGADKVDGVISIDTQVFTDLLIVLGAVEVPGYGNFSPEIDPRCDCPQAIYQLEDMTTKPLPYMRNDRKAVLGPLMQTVLYKAYGSGSETWPVLFNVLSKNLTQKHILFYFFDDNMQSAVESNNFAGRLTPPSNDYLLVNDSNFGGAKSNIFVSQEINHEITTASNTSSHKVTFIYKNPSKGSNCNLEAGKLCLNGVLRDWVRLYLPPGAELTNSSGFKEGSVKQSEDLGYAVIEGFLTVNPESQTTVSVEYTTPFQQKDNYNLLLQKQPGAKPPDYALSLNGKEQTFVLETDKTLSIPIK